MNANLPPLHLEELSSQLHTIVAAQCPQLSGVVLRCVIKEAKLLVLMEHQPSQSLESRWSLAVLRQGIRQYASLHQMPVPPSSEWLTVQIYLREIGEAQPYAFLPFEVLSPSETEDALTAEPPSGSPTDAASDTQDEADRSPSSPTMPSPRSNPTDPTSHELAFPATAENHAPSALAPRDGNGDRSIPEPFQPRTKILVSSRKRRFASPLWLAGIALGLGAIAGGVYMLTRPCVIGHCLPLQQAAELNDQAADLIQSPQSAQAVVDAYHHLAEASYLIGRIPPWSAHHAEAQALRQSYDQQAAVLNQVVQAQSEAYQAAQKSQNPPHSIETWQEIQTHWQTAIAFLSDVPTESPVYPLAQQKLAEYEANLNLINRRIEMEREAQQQVQSARETAAIAEARAGVAHSSEGWSQAHRSWQAAVQALQRVSANTMSYAEAQQLLALYQPRLAEARDRLTQETIARRAYDESLELANQAQSYEQESQWSQAVTSWRDALNNAQQVPEGSTYHTQAQPLIQTYTEALNLAQDQLRLATALQTAEGELEKICSRNSRPCTYLSDRDHLEVHVTPSYFQQVEPRTPTLTSTSANPVVIAGAINDLLREVGQVGRLTQIPIEFYNADGSLFGTYEPEMDGYVPPQAIVPATTSPSTP